MMLKRIGMKKGFSLVEILVVLVILAIIAAGGMMIAGKGTDRAKFVRAQQDLDTIQKAFIQYYNVLGSYADVGTGDLSTCFTTGTTPDPQEVFQSFIGKRLADWKDPWDREYSVTCTVSANQRGNLVVYAKSGATLSPALDDFTAPTIGSGAQAIDIGQILSDKVSNPKQTESPMFRIVYSVNY